MQRVTVQIRMNVNDEETTLTALKRNIEDRNLKMEFIEVTNVIVYTEPNL